MNFQRGRRRLYLVIASVVCFKKQLNIEIVSPRSITCKSKSIQKLKGPAIFIYIVYIRAKSPIRPIRPDRILSSVAWSDWEFFYFSLDGKLGLGVFLIIPRLDASPPQGYPHPPLNLPVPIYTTEWRGTLHIKLSEFTSVTPFVKGIASLLKWCVFLFLYWSVSSTDFPLPPKPQ